MSRVMYIFARKLDNKSGKKVNHSYIHISCVSLCMGGIISKEAKNRGGGIDIQPGAYHFQSPERFCLALYISTSLTWAISIPGTFWPFAKRVIVLSARSSLLHPDSLFSSRSSCFLHSEASILYHMHIQMQTHAKSFIFLYLWIFLLVLQCSWSWKYNAQ